MAAATYPITIEQGVPFVRSVTVKAGRAAMSLSGYTATAQIRAQLIDESVMTTPGDPLATFACSIATPANGIISIELTDAQTAAIPATNPGQVWVWDLKIKKDSDNGFRLLAGPVTVLSAVTVP